MTAEAKFDYVEYSHFARYFVENVDNMNLLTHKAEKLLSEGKEVSTALENEIFRHKVIVNILSQAGQERYGKTPTTIYQMGWLFEAMGDDEIEKIYGRK